MKKRGMNSVDCCKDATELGGAAHTSLTQPFADLPKASDTKNSTGHKRPCNNPAASVSAKKSPKFAVELDEDDIGLLQVDVDKPIVSRHIKNKLKRCEELTGSDTDLLNLDFEKGEVLDDTDQELMAMDVDKLDEIDNDDIDLLNLVIPTTSTSNGKQSGSINLQLQSTEDIAVNKTYGLVETRPVAFEDVKIPTEILMRIFALVPLHDILLSLSRVCSRFNTIIIDKEFIPYRKLFYKYLAKETDATVKKQVDAHLVSAGIVNPEEVEGVDTAIILSIAYLRKLGRVTCHEQIMTVLQRQPSFANVKKLVHDKLLPLISLEEKKASGSEHMVWVYFGAMVFLLDIPGDICQLIGAVVCGGANVDDVTECLYCLATFLLALHRHSKFKIVPRHFYNIISAINFYENKLPTYMICGGMLALTPEQERIVSYDLSHGEVVRIIAFAGTGKTSTLRSYCEKRPDKKFLVLMFNKPAQEEAERKFPRNATCQTTHSLAYDLMQVGSIYPGRIPNLTAVIAEKSGVLKEIYRPGTKGLDSYMRTHLSIQTLNNYLVSNSKDVNIEEKFVPKYFYNVDKVGQNVEKRAIDNEEDRLCLTMDAQNLWDAMCDTQNKDPKKMDRKNCRYIPMTHDGYLKLFQLACRANLPAKVPLPYKTDKPLRIHDYDMMLIDEAQDMNPATLDALRAQSMPKIFVGDPNQQIYAFRGAVDALDIVLKQYSSPKKNSGTVLPLKTFYLTTSFRFGHRIAYVANCWLQAKKMVEGKLLIGNNGASSLNADIPEETQLCYICRTNAKVFELCTKMVSSPDLQRNKFHAIGGLEKFGLDDMNDIYELMMNEGRASINVRNPRFKKFSSIKKLKENALKYNDHDLMSKIKIVEQHKEKIPEYVDKIKRFHCGFGSDAKYLLTTAHKVKGMEFDAVAIQDDFSAYLKDYTSIRKTEDCQNELNLLYVSITRAKKYLIMNEPVRLMLYETLNEHLEIPQFYGESQARHDCTNCERMRQFQPNSLYLQRTKISMVNKSGETTTCEAGFLCKDCCTGDLRLEYNFRKEGRLTDRFTSNGLTKEPTRRAYKQIIM